MAPAHRGLSSERRFHKEDTAWEKGTSLGKSETNTEHIGGTENGAMGARTIRRLEPTKRSETSLFLEIQRSTLGPDTRRTASWERQATSDTCTSPTTSPRRPGRTRNQRSSCDSTSSPSSTQTQGEIPKHANVRAQAQIDSRSQQQTTMGGECSCCTCRECVARQRLRNFISDRSKPTKRAAESMTLDVPSQAKHP